MVPPPVSSEGFSLRRQQAAPCRCQAGAAGNERRRFVFRSSTASGIRAAFRGGGSESFTDTFFLTISYAIAMSIHRRSFLLQKVAAANTASFSGVFWFIITFLLGEQPGCTLQCSVTSLFQPVILTAILTPAPHRPGLQYTRGSSLRAQGEPARPCRERRSRLSAPSTSPRAPTVPKFRTVGVRDWSWDSWAQASMWH